jgi:cytochrome b involved in lipid metabolism
MKYYTQKEVSVHNKKTDCWLIANNNVYDVTRFIEKHPIGSEPIIKRAGNDCTVDYNFHSKISKKCWDEYKIGEIKKNCCCLIS